MRDEGRPVGRNDATDLGPAARHSLDEAGMEMVFRELVENTQDVVIVTDALLDRPGPLIRYVNPAFTQLTGWRAEEVLGQSPRMLQGPGTDPATLAAIGAALRRGERCAAQVMNYARNGAPYWIDIRIVPLLGPGGRITGFASIGRDATLIRRRMDELAHLTDRDTLTGIPNRRALLRAVAEIAARQDAAAAPRSATAGMALAWLDIDRFGRINETFGEAAGDSVLMGVADLLAENLRRADLLGRVGGEEFVICMPGLGPVEAEAAAHRLRAVIAATPFPTEAGPLRITCSLGICCQAAGEWLTALLHRTEAALHTAKIGGRNRVSMG